MRHDDRHGADRGRRAMSSRAGSTRAEELGLGLEAPGRRPVGEQPGPPGLDLDRGQALPGSDVGLPQPAVDRRPGRRASRPAMISAVSAARWRSDDHRATPIGPERASARASPSSAAPAPALVAERRVGPALPAPQLVPRRQPVADAEHVDRHRRVVPDAGRAADPGSGSGVGTLGPWRSCACSRRPGRPPARAGTTSPGRPSATCSAPPAQRLRPGVRRGAGHVPGLGQRRSGRRRRPRRAGDEIAVLPPVSGGAG